MNAGAIACGKNVVLSKRALVAGGIDATVAAGIDARMAPTGLYPRNAANKAEVGDMWLNAGASCDAPAEVSALEIALGKLTESASRTIVKNRARLIVCPTF